MLWNITDIQDIYRREDGVPNEIRSQALGLARLALRLTTPASCRLAPRSPFPFGRMPPSSNCRLETN